MSGGLILLTTNGVAHHANTGSAARHLSRLVGRLANQFRTDGEVVAEASETEPLAQASLLDLDPTDHFQVAGGYAEQCALPRQVIQNLFHAGHAHKVQLMTAFGHRVAHGFKDGLDARLQQRCRYAGLLARLAQDGCIRAAVQQDAGQRDFKARYPVHAGGKRINMHAVAAAQQRAVDVKQIRILRIPGETRLNGDARFICRRKCQHVLRRIFSLGGRPNVPRLIQDVRCAADA